MTTAVDIPVVERMARAIWERRTGGNWEARMTWVNASPELRAASAAHPDCFDTRDLDEARADVLAALRAAREPTLRMLNAGWGAGGAPGLHWQAMIDAAIAEAVEIS